jgi:hypothetical protein
MMRGAQRWCIAADLASSRLVGGGVLAGRGMALLVRRLMRVMWHQSDRSIDHLRCATDVVGLQLIDRRAHFERVMRNNLALQPASRRSFMVQTPSKKVTARD